MLVDSRVASVFASHAAGAVDVFGPVVSWRFWAKPGESLVGKGRTMSRKEQTSPFNMWWWAAAGFIVVVLIAALGLVFLTKSGNNSTPESEQQPPAEGASNPPAQTKNNECQGLSDDQSYPTSAPETKWEAYDNSSFTVPISEEFGPLEHDGKMPKCFAHSPTGAVFAGINLEAAFSIGGVYEAAMDSPEAKKEFDELAEAEGSGSYVAVKGFRVDSYTGDAATVSYYGSEGNINASLTFQLVWDDEAGDWKRDVTTPHRFVQDPPASDFVTWR